ncbi:MAG: hypothetical protein ABIF22_02175 [bacterium]
MGFQQTGKLSWHKPKGVMGSNPNQKKASVSVTRYPDEDNHIILVAKYDMDGECRKLIIRTNKKTS